MFKFNLLPKDDTFHRLLQKMSSDAQRCALHLKTFVESADEAARAAAAKGLDECKASSKATLSDITSALCKSYITPFDREDIQALSFQLYKITKTMDKVRERMQLHGLSSHRDDFYRQTALIVREADAMHLIMQDLSQAHKPEIQSHMAILQELELQGDAVLGELLVSLFNEGHSMRDLILRKDIYDMLEKVIDRYRDAGSIVLEIVLKHG
jgi:uncharacterized protein Yka (UPF0111/DUF47 family)